jgi:CheY-like chemotaxis protein
VFWITLPATVLPPGPIRLTDAAPGFRSPPHAGINVVQPHAGINVVQPHAGINVVMIGRPAPRTRILLAEDVVANQLVTATLLRRQGHLVDIAASGPAVIEAVKGTPYDLIFMDIFMPGISGPEATQIIRSLPEPARSTPIVALTANAYPEDAEIFRAAGMDGLLGKPVSPAELTEVISRHVWWPNPAASTFSTHQVAEPQGSMPVLSATRLHELRDNLPSAKFAELLNECLAEMDDRMPALRRALTAGRTDAVAAQAHALVGMAASHGMAALEVRLRTVLNATRGVGTNVLDLSLMQRLETDFQEAAVQLRDWL